MHNSIDSGSCYPAVIETPEADIPGISLDEYRQDKVMNNNNPWPYVRVLHGEFQPEKAFVAVHYRENWFWIEDKDLYSRYMFNFLMILFSFTERGKGDTEPPVLTVPTN